MPATTDLNTASSNHAAICPNLKQFCWWLLAFLPHSLPLAPMNDELPLEVGQELEILLLLQTENTPRNDYILHPNQAATQSCTF